MKPALITAISLILPFILWGKLILFSLTQDDFYLISQAVFNSPSQQFLTSFPNQDSIFFRPLGMQGYFYLFARIFWLSAWKYRLVSILFHGINSILVYKISRKIINSGSIFVWLMYLISPWQFAAIGWVANISYLTGAMLALSSILAGLGKNKKLSWLFFTLGILTNELALVVPALILMLNFWKDRPQPLAEGGIRWLVPMGVIAGVYGVIRLNFPSASTGDYRFGIGWNIIQNLRWLSMWTLGWPETYRDQFISFFTIDKSFLTTFFWETIIFIAASLAVLTVSLKSLKDRRLVLLGLLWFVTALTPVIFFSRHIFPHYVIIASVGLYLIIAAGLSRLSKQLKIIFITLWTIQSLAGLRINLSTHWWVQHTILAQSLVDQIKSNYPNLPESKMILIKTDNPQRAKLVLSGDNAVRLLYNDPSAKLTVGLESSFFPNLP